MADLKVMLETAKESVLRTVAETAEKNPGMTLPELGKLYGITVYWLREHAIVPFGIKPRRGRPTRRSL
jgi:hypothetical protein